MEYADEKPSKTRRFFKWLRHQWFDPMLLTSTATTAVGSLFETHDWQKTALVSTGVSLGVVGGYGKFRQSPSYTELLEERKEAARLADLSQDELKDDVRKALRKIASGLSLNASAWASVHIYDSGRFVTYTVYSQDPTKAPKVAAVAEEGHGWLGIGWRQGHVCVSRLPDPVAKWDNYQPELVARYHFNMDATNATKDTALWPRSVVVIRYPDDMESSQPLGLLQIASDKPMGVTSDTMRKIRSDPSWQILTTLLRTQSKSLPQMTDSAGKGF